MKILIAGGGITGLTAALALHARGLDVSVFEAAPQLTPLGVGINLLPHSVRILTELGLQQRLLAKGVATRELVYFNRFGQRIWGEPRGKWAGYDWPQISLHRGVLQMTLLEAVKERLGPDAIKVDRRLVDLQQDEVGVRLTLQDGMAKTYAAEGDALIACDGIHSTVRGRLYPKEGSPVYGGRVLWRGVTMAKPFLTGATMIMAGYQDQKFVCYPIEAERDGLQAINWIAELSRETIGKPEDWNRAGALKDFLPPFESWDFGWLDAPALIREADRIFEYPLVDRDPVAQWTFGRVTIAGDAAHPMYPIGSNGASQGILDADALARAFAGANSAQAALQTFEAERRPPTSAIVLANRGNGPEQCMQLAHERAPQGFDDIETVMPRAELEAIAARYKQVAGFTREALAVHAQTSEPAKEPAK